MMVSYIHCGILKKLVMLLKCVCVIYHPSKKEVKNVKIHSEKAFLQGCAITWLRYFAPW